MTKDELISQYPYKEDFTWSIGRKLQIATSLALIVGAVVFKDIIGTTVMIAVGVPCIFLVLIALLREDNTGYNDALRKWEDLVWDEYAESLPKTKYKVYSYDINDDHEARMIVNTEDDTGEVFTTDDIRFHSGKELYVECVLIEGLSDYGIDDEYIDIVLCLPREKN